MQKGVVGGAHQQLQNRSNNQQLYLSQAQRSKLTFPQTSSSSNLYINSTTTSTLCQPTNTSTTTSIKPRTTITIKNQLLNRDLPKQFQTRLTRDQIETKVNQSPVQGLQSTSIVVGESDFQTSPQEMRKSLDEAKNATPLRAAKSNPSRQATLKFPSKYGNSANYSRERGFGEDEVLLHQSIKVKNSKTGSLERDGKNSRQLTGAPNSRNTSQPTKHRNGGRRSKTKNAKNDKNDNSQNRVLNFSPPIKKAKVQKRVFQGSLLQTRHLRYGDQNLNASRNNQTKQVELQTQMSFHPRKPTAKLMTMHPNPSASVTTQNFYSGMNTSTVFTTIQSNDPNTQTLNRRGRVSVNRHNVIEEPREPRGMLKTVHTSVAREGSADYQNLEGGLATTAQCASHSILNSNQAINGHVQGPLPLNLVIPMNNMKSMHAPKYERMDSFESRRVTLEPTWGGMSTKDLQESVAKAPTKRTGTAMMTSRPKNMVNNNPLAPDSYQMNETAMNQTSSSGFVSKRNLTQEKGRLYNFPLVHQSKTLSNKINQRISNFIASPDRQPQNQVPGEQTKIHPQVTSYLTESLENQKTSLSNQTFLNNAKVSIPASKTALIDFLQNILHKGNPQINEHSSQIAAQLSLNESNVPVIKQLPNRFYKGIISSMKRKRMKQSTQARQLNINHHSNQWPHSSSLANQATAQSGEEQLDDKDKGSPRKATNGLKGATSGKDLLGVQDNNRAILSSSDLLKNKEKFVDLIIGSSQRLYDKQQQKVTDPKINSEASLKDLEEQFKQECDDLLVSISANWQTIPELESGGNTESLNGFELEAAETVYKSRPASNNGDIEFSTVPFESNNNQILQFVPPYLSSKCRKAQARIVSPKTFTRNTKEVKQPTSFLHSAVNPLSLSKDKICSDTTPKAQYLASQEAKVSHFGNSLSGNLTSHWHNVPQPTYENSDQSRVDEHFAKTADLKSDIRYKNNQFSNMAAQPSHQQAKNRHILPVFGQNRVINSDLAQLQGGESIEYRATSGSKDPPKMVNVPNISVNEFNVGYGRPLVSPVNDSEDDAHNDKAANQSQKQTVTAMIHGTTINNIREQIVSTEDNSEREGIRVSRLPSTIPISSQNASNRRNSEALNNNSSQPLSCSYRITSPSRQH